MKISAGLFATFLMIWSGSISAAAQETVQREDSTMQTVRLHVDGFMKSRSGAT